MLWLILTLCIGICAGIVIRKSNVSRHIGKAISATIYVMLFMLGARIGTDRHILESLSTLGVQALILAAAGIVGSVISAAILYRIAEKKKSGQI